MNHGTHWLRSSGLLGLLLVAGVATSAQAQSPYAGTAWVWASTPSATGCYNPVNWYSRSSLGGVNQVCNNPGGTVGYYTVDFANFSGYGGNVQVTSYGPGNERCKVQGWGPVTGAMRAHIRCHTPSGAAANTQFVAFFRSYTQTVSGGQWGAYLWSSNAAATHTPSPTYQWNANGSLSTVIYNGTGNYTAVLTGQNQYANSVLVTAYGGGSEHCKVGGWWVDASNNMNVNVLCFNTSGAPANSLFTLNYTSSTHDFGPGGNVWAHDVTSANYVPSTWYQYNSTGATNTAGNFGGATVGSYWVQYPGLNAWGPDSGWGEVVSSTALVTAYGSGAEYCKLNNWHNSTGGSTVEINCFNASGAPVNTRFVSAFMNNEYPPPP
jgi:hypothetical protein